MSIRIMSRIWDAGPPDPMQRIVLLAIADHADDQGRAYPSMVGIASKCGMTERGARGIIRKLEAAGYLETRIGGGRGGKSHYTVNPEPETRNDKPGMSKPGTTRPETRNETALNPEPRSAEPSVTIKEPPKSRETPVDVLCKIVRHETATDFAAHRKAMKKPLTHEAARRLVSKLANHPDPDAVFDLSIENGWQGVFPEKIGGRNVHTNYNTTPDRPANRADPALEQIARIAGLNQASGNGGR